MKSDESIEAERAAMAKVIGPTHAEWYADACRMEYGTPHAVLLWACRCRELARTKARDLQELGGALEQLMAACSRLDEGGGDRVRTAMDSAEATLDLIFGKEGG